MKFSLKYLALLCLLMSSISINASENMNFHNDKILSKTNEIYQKPKDYCDCIVYIPCKGTFDDAMPISNELKQSCPILDNGEFEKHYVFDSYLKSSKFKFSYDKNQKETNKKRLSINISHSLFLFRQLITSMTQLQKKYITGNIRNGFCCIFKYIIDQLINYEASNPLFKEKKISEETKQKLINFKEVYDDTFFVTTDSNKLKKIYDEFEKILTEENNKISHTWDS